MASMMVQPGAFVAFALCGGCIGLLYSVLAGVRHGVGNPKWLRWSSDVMFVLLAGLTFAACLWIWLQGELRVFAAVAYVLGFGIVWQSVGQWLAQGIRMVVQAVVRWMRRAIKRLHSKLENQDENG